MIIQPIQRNVAEHFSKQRIAEILYQKKQLRVLKMQSCDNNILSRATVLDSKNQEYTLNIINMFNGIGGICEDIRKDVQDQIEFMKLMNHQHIIKYIDSFEVDFFFFIQLEKFEMNLEEWILKQPDSKVSTFQTLNFAVQLISAIAEFHSQNYSIKDLNVSNIMINKKNEIKLFKFGYVNSNIFEKNRCLDLSQNFQKPIFFNKEIEKSIIDKKIKNPNITQQLKIDVLSYLQVLYVLAGANTLNSANPELEIDNLDQEFFQLILRITNANQKKNLSSKEILENLTKYRESILSNDEFMKQIYFSAISPLQQSQIAINQLLLLNHNNYQKCECLHKLGDIYIEESKFLEAIEAYSESLHIDPFNFQCDDGLTNAKLMQATENSHSRFSNFQIENLPIPSLIKVKELPKKKKPALNQNNDNNNNNKTKYVIGTICLTIFALLPLLTNYFKFKDVDIKLRTCKKDLDQKDCLKTALTQTDGYLQAQYWILNQEIKINPNDVFLNYLMAQTLIDLNSEPKYLQIVENPLEKSFYYIKQCFAAVVTNNDESDKYFCYVIEALYFTKKNQWNEALSSIKKCDTNKFPFCHVILGALYDRLDKPDLAEKHYNELSKKIQNSNGIKELFQLNFQ